MPLNSSCQDVGSSVLSWSLTQPIWERRRQLLGTCSRTNVWQFPTYPRRRIPAFLPFGIKASCVCLCVFSSEQIHRYRKHTLIVMVQDPAAARLRNIDAGSCSSTLVGVDLMLQEVDLMLQEEFDFTKWYLSDDSTIPMNKFVFERDRNADFPCL